MISAYDFGAISPQYHHPIGRLDHAAKPILSDERILPVEIHIHDAWILISGLQLALRHPGITAGLRGSLSDICGQFEGAITELYPEAAELLAQGRDPEQDVPSTKDEVLKDAYKMLMMLRRPLVGTAYIASARRLIEKLRALLPEGEW